MKYVLLIMDGATDLPLPELDGRTPLEVAKTPNLDALAERGRVGACLTVPETLYVGSDVANMAIFGYDPEKHYTGRGPIEAASLKIPLNERDVVYRCNLVSTDGETMVDYSGGHVSTDEARVLITYLEEKLGGRKYSFYPGIQYRHLMVWRDGVPDQETTPPHDIMGKPLADYLPTGEKDDVLRQLMWDSLELLDGHEINRVRREEGKLPANMIWLWGQGFAPRLESFAAKFGLPGAVVAAVDLIRGIGYLAGLQVLDVPGATGYLDTNYRGKAEAALQALQALDLVIVHVEAPDEAGHQGNLDAKIEAIQRIDSDIVGPLREGLAPLEEGWRFMALPDHATPISLRTHSRGPVPFLLYDSRVNATGPRLPYDERGLAETRFHIERGEELLPLLLEKR
jgi:2,3-bisphosphoglycerate-independent phosphoglycerate mutase